MRLSRNEFFRIMLEFDFTFLQPEEKIPNPTVFQNFNMFGSSIPVDNLNIRFSKNDKEIRKKLFSLMTVQGMSTLANAYIISRITEYLDENEVYLNIGVYKGFSFLAGVLNRNSKSIGVDNFSEFGGPKDEFLKNYNPLSHDKSSFFDISYEEYLEKIHKDKIGFYFYDGAHDYKSQYESLTRAEKFFSKNVIIMVDDTNHPPARDATLQFVRDRHSKYEILLDQFTAMNGHPTHHNGLMIIRGVE